MSVIVGEPVTPDVPGEWRSIQDAARHLSVSERTVYRRADRGQLRRRTLPDGRVEVFVPATTPADTSDATSDNDSHERAALLVDRVSVAVSRQLETLTIELTASRERIEALARENGTLGERLARVTEERDTARAELAELRFALAAPRSPVEAPGAPEPPDPTPGPPTESAAPSTSSGQARGPWWKRWRAWLVAGLLGAVVASASCQASASMKHPGLCSSVHEWMDAYATALAAGGGSASTWQALETMVNVGGKVC
jgi:hypothetical protein